MKLCCSLASGNSYPLLGITDALGGRRQSSNTHWRNHRRGAHRGVIVQRLPGMCAVRRSQSAPRFRGHVHGLCGWFWTAASGTRLRCAGCITGWTRRSLAASAIIGLDVLIDQGIVQAAVWRARNVGAVLGRLRRPPWRCGWKSCMPRSCSCTRSSPGSGGGVGGRGRAR